MLLELLEDRVQQWPEHMIYVVSLSENGDLLSQWRAYCPDRRGINLGFSRTQLREIAAAQTFELRRCVYTVDRQKRILRAILKRAIDRLVRPRAGDDHGSWSKQCLHDFARLAPLLKHPSFSEEREWRLIGRLSVDRLAEVRYRVGASLLVPYVAVTLPPKLEGVLRKVRVGPTPHPRLAIDAVITCMYTHGIRNVEITSATSPYRSW